jgi:hypothetical protein
MYIIIMIIINHYRKVVIGGDLTCARKRAAFDPLEQCIAMRVRMNQPEPVCSDFVLEPQKARL